MTHTVDADTADHHNLPALYAAMLAAIDSGDPAAARIARDRLILAMVPLALHMARRLARTRPHLLDDFRSACLLAAVRAADNWNPAASSAGYWIARMVDQEITHLIAGDCPLSFGVALKRRRIARWPDGARLAVSTRRTDLRAVPDRGGWAVSDDPAFLRADARMDAAGRLAALPDRLRDVVSARFGIGRPAESGGAVARRLGVRADTVSGLLAAGLLALGCASTGRRAIAGGADAPRSAHRGVYWIPRKGKWRAEVCFGGGRAALGYFATEDQAADAVGRARDRLAAGLPARDESARVGRPGRPARAVA